MKIILSRKGFDNENGGYPSPILPDGTLLSIPIPLAYDDDNYKPIKYEDVSIPNDIKDYLLKKKVKIETYKDLLSNILCDYPILYKKNWYSIISPIYCHVDPDLIKDVLEREDSQNWRPTFGQNEAAQGHLKNQRVEPGDLFLYFGWFRHTVINNGKLCYNSSEPDKHLIFGYLEIEYFLNVKEEIKKRSWLKTHPHSFGELLTSKNNTIYIARQSLSWKDECAGAGLFKYSENLVLTETNPEINPRRNLSVWKYNFIPPGTYMTYHKDKSWIKEKNYFQAVGKGQEFVINNCPEFEEYVKNLNYHLKD